MNEVLGSESSVLSEETTQTTGAGTTTVLRGIALLKDLFLQPRRQAGGPKAGPASMRAWRTALPILARLRRERMGAAGLIEFPAVGAL